MDFIGSVSHLVSCLICYNATSYLFVAAQIATVPYSFKNSLKRNSLYNPQEILTFSDILAAGRKVEEFYYIDFISQKLREF